MFATPNDVLDRYDETVVRDLCSDNGTAEADLDTSSKMAAAIASAEGYVLAACQTQQLYTQADLASLTGPGAALLVDLVCGLTMAHLLRRRPGANEALAKQLERFDAFLDALRSGTRMFPIAANLDASVVALEGPTTVEVTNLNLITSRASGYYPRVSSRLPIGQQ